eukprot:Gregarina_sp_Pseudo_9__1399@NODE_1937_length_1245_cov_10_508292_g1796_i0_p3_GENE_NODE_1937_length_1245_cov_10_508292_g1796_i0NODE_1937_length_1245_cov_10_508292_g1796_i0_p3_ORF_typecomplete_len164_score17_63_NODE_1937_length_1245_cov_10_508292_g1796_i06781169
MKDQGGFQLDTKTRREKSDVSVGVGLQHRLDTRVVKLLGLGFQKPFQGYFQRVEEFVWEQWDVHSIQDTHNSCRVFDERHPYVHEGTKVVTAGQLVSERSQHSVPIFCSVCHNVLYFEEVFINFYLAENYHLFNLNFRERVSPQRCQCAHHTLCHPALPRTSL